MKTTRVTKTASLLLLAGSLLAVAARPAAAADFYLDAVAYDATMPDLAVVRMWGFAACDATFATCGAPSSPGPTLQIPAAEPAPTVLNIHLKNELATPISLLIPDQLAPLAPVKFDDGSGRMRTRSMTAETAPGAVGLYSWPAFRPGTFLYQSGTQPQVQVQMGLLGAVTYDAALGQAYPGVPYDSEVLLVFSEIDPALHAAVVDGSYGTPAYPSTFDYRPAYFLVNGAPYSVGDAPLPAGATGGRTLLRLVNGGLMHRVPQILGVDLSFIAEEGQPYPFGELRYNTLLAAGTTQDAILAPTAAGIFTLFDRMLNLTTKQATGGGMYVQLQVATGGAGLTSAGMHTLASGPQMLASSGTPDLHLAPHQLTAIAPALTKKVPRKVVLPRTQPLPRQILQVVSQRPLGSEQTVQTKAGQPVTIVLVKKNKSGNSTDPRSVAIVVQPRLGSKLINNHDGTVTFVPSGRYIPSDTFDYTTRDRSGAVSEPVTVLVEIVK